MYVTKMRHLAICFFILFAVGSLSAVAQANFAPVAVYVDSVAKTKTGFLTQLSCVFFDQDGWEDIDSCNLLINDVLSNQGGVELIYSPGQNLMYMKNNAGVISTGRPTWSNYKIETENAILDCSQSYVNYNDRWITVTFMVNFKPAMANRTCNYYMSATDLGGASAPWMIRGQLNIQLNVPPTLVSVSPSSGTIPIWKWTTITCKYSDANGDYMPTVSLLINDKLSNSGGAHFFYNGDTVYMKNNAGDTVYGYDTSVIETENAFVDCSATTLTVTGNTYTVTWRVMLKQTLSNKVCNLYMRANDEIGTSAGWTSKGQVTIGSATNNPPAIGSLTPDSGFITRDQYTTVTTTYSDADGAENLKTCSLLINNELSNQGGGHFIYDCLRKTFQMKSGSGEIIDYSYSPYLDNGNAILDKNSSSVVVNGNTITIKWAISLGSKMARKCNMYMSTKDYTGAWVTWTKKGQVTLNNAPVLGGVTPDACLLPTDQWTSFTTTYYDPDGAANLTQCEMLLNTSKVNAGGAHFIYDRAENKLYMKNDRDALVGGTPLGVAGIVQTENAMVDCKATTVSVSGYAVTVNWRVKFKSTMDSKRCGLFMQASDGYSKQPWAVKGCVTFNTNPVAQTVTPASLTTSIDQWNRISCTYADLDGVVNLATCSLLVNNSISSLGATHVFYDANQNKIYMKNNAGQIIGGIAPGSNIILDSENASIDCAATTVCNNDYMLFVNWCIKFKSSMVGKTCKSYMKAVDDMGGTQAWTQLGSVEVITAHDTYSDEMIYIPAGSFAMGINYVDSGGLYDESAMPKHTVYLSGYFIGKHEVTRGQYRQFINESGYLNPAYWSVAGWAWKQDRTEPEYWSALQQPTEDAFTQTDDFPVIGVSYYEAEAFCNWAGGHLPTEAQWEKAASWNASINNANMYPWGDQWDGEKCNNLRDSNSAAGGFGKLQPAPVGSYPNSASAYGCEDMAGNVAEWCRDLYSNIYYTQTPSFGWIDPQGFGYGDTHAVRGGSFASWADECRCAQRKDFAYQTETNIWLGFRLAR